MKNTTPSKAAEICESIGYPKIKYFGKRRPGVSHDEMLDKVFSEWYKVADSFCRRIGIKPSRLLAQAYWLNGEEDLSTTLEPSCNHQQMIKEASGFDKVSQIIRKHFLGYVRPMQS
jgi:hypothetical protein